MHLPPHLRSLLVTLAMTAAAGALAACETASSTSDVPESADIAPENVPASEALAEQHDAATATWAVKPDGHVRLRLTEPDGTPIEDGVSGTLTVRPLAPDAKPVNANLEFDARTGLYTAAMPELDDELTEMSYEIDVKGKPIKGALHLPKGGTKELVANAKVNAEIELPKDKKGPNGGVVQVAGEDILEIVADPKSGEARVYVLDDDFKPMPVGKRKVEIGVVAASPEMVALAPDPEGLYFTGKIGVKANPHKLTVVLHGEGSHPPAAVLYGYAPGSVVVVGPSAPSVGFFVVGGFSPVIVVAPHSPVIVVGKGKGKWRFKKPKMHFKIH
ncbi:hypothetical protein [Polyangium aurulentum]|uniref:hypothetical protein n=1 Tax=Polyangium aurulentum TaxID=2567896 RepID=UPI0010ADB746|nr:hypothetical protein [Polyangium aurulentum]UQA57836.1 hypothetical protein E8A73_042260 [Polyangium aurulentum]